MIKYLPREIYIRFLCAGLQNISSGMHVECYDQVYLRYAYWFDNKNDFDLLFYFLNLVKLNYNVGKESSW